ncbi:hypothetical protein BHE74_00044000 [Ensete ventricosum]|uniref:Uncharacterized protein n=1 Tax=Ensete ventricosum TaxID=4639 RepID=A0A426YW69_ENSVE|nr:hypothetical protein B296_00043016 [Ensete ventricosum]RWW13239.1 hypothetical protein GW17_00023052 [Ensete ventricosum]RWW49781.1 hypothetical protein BHE74_00044000 [Ensete ventricosum]
MSTPTFFFVETGFCIYRKTRKGDGENGSDCPAVEIPELDAKDRKCFEVVETLIKDGQMEKLKVDQCKVYLRKYGLRLTGKKDTLIRRIREHLEYGNFIYLSLLT